MPTKAEITVLFLWLHWLGLGHSVIAGLGWDEDHPLRPWLQSSRSVKRGSPLSVTYTCFSFCGIWVGWTEPLNTNNLRAGRSS